MTEITQKYTPGPWEVAEDTQICSRHPDDAMLDAVAEVDTDDENWRGNARLIAAAPTMNAGLEKIEEIAAPGQEIDIYKAREMLAEIYDIARTHHE